MASLGFQTGIKRPVGRALIVGSASARGTALSAMQALGFTCAEVDDPYAAVAELCKRPLVYRALILSLASLYREELTLIATIKQRLPHVDVWLTHIDGRQAALVEAIRMGANGLLGEDASLHPFSPTSDNAQSLPPDDLPIEAQPPAAASMSADDMHDDSHDHEPVLSADELRALLQEQPMMPPEIES